MQSTMAFQYHNYFLTDCSNACEHQHLLIDGSEKIYDGTADFMLSR